MYPPNHREDRHAIKTKPSTRYVHSCTVFDFRERINGGY